MLKTGAILNFILAAAHLLCLPWLYFAFRLYGIEDMMLQIAEHGAILPYLLTVVIAGCFALCGFYALSGAGVIRRLPLLRLGIFFVAAVFLFRGIAGVCGTLSSGSYPLTAVSSVVIALSIGLLYLLGGIFQFRPISQAIYAGGCFWGVEHLMQQQKGVKSVVSGYIGGNVKNPTYEQVKSHTTGHLEAVLVTYYPSIISYEELTKLFFEIHDPTQEDGQGPDIGPQYYSAIFYATKAQKATAQKLIDILKSKGYNVVTRLSPATHFYPAEDYHQDYYEHKGTEPYCHFRTRRF